MSPQPPLLDPITLEIIWNGLKSINDESWITIQKSAFSTNIKERHDHSTAIADAQGRADQGCRHQLEVAIDAAQQAGVDLLGRCGRLAARRWPLCWSCAAADLVEI